MHGSQWQCNALPPHIPQRCHTVLHSCCHREDMVRTEQMDENRKNGIKKKLPSVAKLVNAEPAAVMDEEKVA